MAAKFHAVLVDDNRAERMVANKVLQTDSFEVTDFDSPAKALDFLRSKNSKKVDLIITDYNMPGMTGLDLMMKVKESSSSRVKNIPVVVMSSDFKIAEMCLANGAHEFIPKTLKKAHAAKLRDDLVAKMSGAGPSGN